MPTLGPITALARARLATLQQPDGRWASEDGPQADVATTLTALRALR